MYILGNEEAVGLQPALDPAEDRGQRVSVWSRCEGIFMEARSKVAGIHMAAQNKEELARLLTQFAS